MQNLPYLTVYDPEGTTEGSIDPLGTYTIADRLASALVPSVRERMSRVRLLTAMAVGARVIEGIEGNPRYPNVPPYLVWEWLVVEAIVRTHGTGNRAQGIPGTHRTSQALARQGYLDPRSYLKSPSVVGFHGTYKRLALHLRMVSLHLDSEAENSAELISAWSDDRDLGEFNSQHELCMKWRDAVERSLKQSPVRTRPGFKDPDWTHLAESFMPDAAGRRERRVLRKHLLAEGDRSLGYFSTIWQLLRDGHPGLLNDDRALHRRLAKEMPRAATLVFAIDAYETFCRHLEDAFSILLAEGSAADTRGLDLASLSNDDDLAAIARHLSQDYDSASMKLADYDPALANLFDGRFASFAEPHDVVELMHHLCAHHKRIQRDKSKEGKRAWFDLLEDRRLYVHYRYRRRERPERTTDYVHAYRTGPIASFQKDLLS